MDSGYAATLAIPPIVALALDRSSGGIDALLREAAALREEFAPFRARYRGYAETLRNPAGLSLSDLLAAKPEALQEVCAALNKVKAQWTDTRLISEVLGASGRTRRGRRRRPARDQADAVVGRAGQDRDREKLRRSTSRAARMFLFDSYAKAMNIRNLPLACGRPARRRADSRGRRSLSSLRGRCGAVRKGRARDGMTV